MWLQGMTNLLMSQWSYWWMLWLNPGCSNQLVQGTWQGQILVQRHHCLHLLALDQLLSNRRPVWRLCHQQRN